MAHEQEVGDRREAVPSMLTAVLHDRSPGPGGMAAVPPARQPLPLRIPRIVATSGCRMNRKRPGPIKRLGRSSTNARENR